MMGEEVRLGVARTFLHSDGFESILNPVVRDIGDADVKKYFTIS